MPQEGPPAQRAWRPSVRQWFPLPPRGSAPTSTTCWKVGRLTQRMSGTDVRPFAECTMASSPGTRRQSATSAEPKSVSSSAATADRDSPRGPARTPPARRRRNTCGGTGPAPARRGPAADPWRRSSRRRPLNTEPRFCSGESATGTPSVSSRSPNTARPTRAEALGLVSVSPVALGPPPHHASMGAAAPPRVHDRHRDGMFVRAVPAMPARG